MPNLIGFILGIIIVIAVCRILHKPLQLIWKLVVNTIIGGIVLVLINTLAHYLGYVGININLITSLITGVFGLPGVAVIILISLIF